MNLNRNRINGFLVGKGITLLLLLSLLLLFLLLSSPSTGAPLSASSSLLLALPSLTLLLLLLRTGTALSLASLTLTCAARRGSHLTLGRLSSSPLSRLEYLSARPHPSGRSTPFHKRIHF